MLMREVSFEARPGAPRRVREFTAAMLRAASRGLDRLALRVARVEAAPEVEPSFEFHAEAGAPEGALYVNGRLLGYLEGVTRL